MSCELHERVLSLDTELGSAEERRRLEEHASTCDTCADTLVAVRAARRVLRNHPVVAPPASRVKIWEAIDQRTSAPRLPFNFAFAGALAGAIAALLLFREPKEVELQPIEPPVQKISATKAPLNLPLKNARVELEKGAQIALGEERLELSEIRLETGSIKVDLDEHQVLDVVTPTARVKLFGAKAVVSADGETKIERGTANVWTKQSAFPKTITPPQPVVALVEKPAVPKINPVVVPQKKQPVVVAVEEPKPDLDATLQRAKEALPKDAPRAAELAEQVLDAAPKTTLLEAEALAVLADAERRRGRQVEAASLYARVVEHPEGRSFAEEALLQRALILARLGSKREALVVLNTAAERFARGPTAPERAALAASLHLENGDAVEAANAIEGGAISGRSLKLLQRRLEVARVLVATDRARAERLLAPVLEDSAPAALRSEAASLLKQ